MKLMKYTALLAAAILSVSAVGCGEKTESKSNDVIFYDDENPYSGNSAETQAVKPEGAKTDAQIGAAASVAGVEATLTEAKTVTTVAPDGYFETDTDIIVYTFEIKNTTDKDVEVSSMSNFTLTIDGTQLDAATSAIALMQASALVPDFTQLDETIPAGETFTGHLATNAPVGWKEIVLEYAPLSQSDNYDYLCYTLTPDNMS